MMKSQKRTTDLNQLKNGAPYTWGEVVTIHEIGEYAIVESIDWASKKTEIMTGVIGDTTKYHPYVNEQNTNHSYSSLDEAIIGAIAYKYDGLNSQAAYFFSKMIGLL